MPDEPGLCKIFFWDLLIINLSDVIFILLSSYLSCILTLEVEPLRAVTVAEEALEGGVVEVTAC